MKRIYAALFALMGFLAAATCLAGCDASPRAQVDRAETLYGATVGELNDLRDARAIDARTFVNVITPARKTARAGIDAANAALRAGETDRVGVLLKGVNQALLELQKYRQQGPRSSIGPATQPVHAVVDPVSAGLMLLGLISRLAPVAGKLIRGEELTPEERAVAERYSAEQTDRADRLDAEARKELQ